MDDYKVTFNKDEIIKNIESIDAIEDRIEYLKYQLSHYCKIYELESDDDISCYLVEYNIRIPNNVNHSFLNNNWSSPNYVNDMIDKFKYMSMKFNGFLKEMLQLIRFTELKLTHYSHAYQIYNSKEFLIFDENLFLHKLKTFKDAKTAYSWTLKYVIVISDISIFLDNYLYDKLYEKCNLSDYYPLDSSLTEESIYKYEPFINHLRKNLLPLIRNKLDRIEVEKDIENARQKYPDKFSGDLDKFPDYDFDYERIILYSTIVFRTYEEKIEYYLFIIGKYDRMIGYNDCIPKNADKCVAQLKKEIENFKEIVNLKSINKKHQEIVPVSIDTSMVTDKLEKISSDLDEITMKKAIVAKDKRKILFFNHYVDVALKLKDIPRQSDLVTKTYNKTFISRLFNNEDFLVEFTDFFKDKLKDKRYKKNAIRIIIDCQNSILALLVRLKNAQNVNDFIDEKKLLKAKKERDKKLFDYEDQDMRYLRGEDGAME